MTSMVRSDGDLDGAVSAAAADLTATVSCSTVSIDGTRDYRTMFPAPYRNIQRQDFQSMALAGGSRILQATTRCVARSVFDGAVYRTRTDKDGTPA